MLESLATTSVHCWLTHARLVRKLHGWVYLGFKVIIVLHQSQMIIDIVEFTSYESFSVI